MDRRRFLKTLGVGVTSCYLPVLTAGAEQSSLLGTLADQSSRSPQSIKVVSMGNDKSLVESMQFELSFCSQRIPIEFISIQGTTEIPIPNVRAIQLPFAGSSVLYDSSGSVRRMALEMQDEIKAAIAGADLVLIAVSLDSDIAFGACDVVAKLARHSGALAVALVVAPFVGSEGIGGITEVHAERVSKQAINRMLTQADCVHAANGWGVIPALGVTYSLLQTYSCLRLGCHCLLP